MIKEIESHSLEDYLIKEKNLQNENGITDAVREIIQEVAEEMGLFEGLTKAQEKLPEPLKKAILKKMKEDGKLSEESEAAYSKLLSKDDIPKKKDSPKKDA